MCNSAFSCVIVGDTVILICQFFAATISGCGNGGFAFASADDFDTAMIDCDNKTSFRATKKSNLAIALNCGMYFYFTAVKKNLRNLNIISPFCCVE